MKLIVFLFTSLCFATSVYSATALDIALEPQSIKVEYMSSSDSGIIYVKGCDQCSNAFYTFKQKPKIIKQGKEISFEIFMTEYWNAKFPTLFLDIKSQAVIRVVY
ncbi:MAG: hypothetical protein V7785_07505 [Bermanella sp.]